MPLLDKCSNTSPYRSEIIEHGFNGNPGPGKKVTMTITRNADIITNMYIQFDRIHNNKLNIPDFYKILKNLILIIGGQNISNIPSDYIVLYCQVIKNLDLKLLSDNKHSIIPVNLGELINCPFIRLPTHHEVRLNCEYHTEEVFDKDIRRKIELNNSWPNYQTYINSQPKDIWKIIMSFLDDKAWSNFRQTCKFFYSIVNSEDIESRYQKYKVIRKDIEDFDCNVKIMYHALSEETIVNTNLGTFMNEIRSIEQIKVDVIDTSFYSNEIYVNNSEWIIIDVDYYQPDILENIELIDKVYISKIDYPELIKDDVTKFGNNISAFILEKYDPLNICRIVKDTNFNNKMHDPSKNRYMYYMNDLIDLSWNNYNPTIKLSFKKKITAKINIYISCKRWVQFGYEMAGVL
jgi:hypothetical protein